MRPSVWVRDWPASPAWWGLTAGFRGGRLARCHPRGGPRSFASAQALSWAAASSASWSRSGASSMDVESPRTGSCRPSSRPRRRPTTCPACPAARCCRRRATRGELLGVVLAEIELHALIEELPRDDVPDALAPVGDHEPAGVLGHAAVGLGLPCSASRPARVWSAMARQICLSKSENAFRNASPAVFGSRHVELRPRGPNNHRVVHENQERLREPGRRVDPWASPHAQAPCSGQVGSSRPCRPGAISPSREGDANRRLCW
jgi:hypothetical protein